MEECGEDAMAKLVLEKVNLWYGKHTHAVKDVDLVVEDGEFCVLLGPSGCGKTSTLRMIAGFLKPTSGKIYMDGLVINDFYPGDREVAMIFQSYALYPHLTVYEQLVFPLKAKKRFSPSQIEEKVRNVAKLLQLEDVLQYYPQELSTGQQQRVAIGRAIIREPKIFLMDEPLSQLDAQLRVQMRANLKKLQRELGITTVYVTHDQTEAQGLADKIVVMNQGVIQQIGTPLEIYEKPKNLFVAGFIGMPAMNFLRGKIMFEGEKAKIEVNDFVFYLSTEISQKLKKEAPSPEIVIGIRPEHLSFTSKSTKENCLEGEVYVVEPQSNELILDIKCGKNVIKARLDKRELHAKPNIGERICLVFDNTHFYAFDPSTEERIL